MNPEALKNNSGISIIEVTVAIFIVTVGLVGVLSLVIQNIEAQYVNKNVLIASGLAQEGIELTRNIRDLNWLTAGNIWYQNLIEESSGLRRFAIDYTGRSSIIDVTGVNDAAANLKTDSYGFYWHGAGAASLFNRLILVEKKTADGAEYLDVKCTIRWVEGGRNHDLIAETFLYDWK